MTEAEKKLSRAFNEVIINPQFGLVFKKSENFTKLNAEAEWYENIPDTLKGLTPKKISLSKSDSGSTVLAMDYCTFPSLFETLTTGLEVDWIRIYNRLLQIHTMFSETPAKDSISQKSLVQFHTNKLRSRVSKLGLMDDFWIALKKKPVLRINGLELKNLELNVLCGFIEAGEDYARPSVVHGDYCFSNILYDLDTDCVKLIDPRGSFSSQDECSVYGDAHYDFAKLLHSFIGYYDFIVGKKYLVDEENHQFGSYTLTIDVPENFRLVGDHIRSQIAQIPVAEQKYIYALHCSLFWSMIPLHYDDFMRQLAFYLRAVQLYNELLDL